MTDIVTLRVEDIHPHPHNNREALNGIEALAANIAANGLLSPLRVVADGDIYWIVAGHRRHAALKHLGAETCEAIVASDWDEAGAVQRIVADNSSTDPLNDMERSRGVQDMLLLGIAPETVAASAGLSEERVGRIAKGFRAVNDATAAEDMTLDDLELIEEFDGDAEAIKEIVNSAAASRRYIADRIRKERTTAAAVAEARAIVEAAGVDLLEERDYSRDSLGSGDQKPDGALSAFIAVDWNGRVSIFWFGEKTAADPAVIAEREKRAAEREHLDGRKAERIAFIASHVETAKPLKQLVDAVWARTGVFAQKDAASSYTYVDYRPSPRIIVDTPCAELSGTATQMFASLLVAIEQQAAHLLTYEEPSAYDVKKRGKQVLAYLDALAASGYAPSELEAERIAGIRTALKPQRKAKKGAE